MFELNVAIDPADYAQFAKATLSMSEWCQRPMTHPGVFNGLLKTYVSHTKKVYATRGAAIGEPWPPLAASTLAARQRQREGASKASNKRAERAARTAAKKGGSDLLILRDTLRLQQSVEDPARRDFHTKMTHQKAEFWTVVPYAIYHQTGTRAMGARSRLSDKKQLRGRGAMPARPLYKMTKAFGDDYNAILKASLYDFMRTRVNGG